ncbi:hypothetical protein RN001_006534 [Aquatica leii]|uniref:Serendipity locus protein alpha n=1 Tax=Aquatica leii TaxID=1421715 RepID=A0AAN7SS97_9COLE|nr:hypothetical protein RN001_006534 [Aquatica leii]
MNTSKIKDNVTNKVNAFKTFLSNNKHKQDILFVVQNVPAYICDIIESCKEFCDNSSLSKQQKFVIITYLMQYYSMYEFLKKTCMSEKDKDVCFQVTECVTKQFLNVCGDVEPLFQENCDNTVGSFIKLMDMVLDTIIEIDVKKGVPYAQSNLNASGVLVEEILCFSMSIAQVSSSEDCKIITASCQVVLHNLDNLKDELGHKEVNLAMCNLLAETYTNSLCALEAKVNLVVLNLCLKAFSDYRSHVIKLYNACLEITNKTALDFVISNFDLYMDRLFQIGLFSLACSNINKRSAEIRIILTNLQFLEQELVPAFMLITTSSLKYRKTYANVLKKFWCLQVKNLRATVHNIIEPEAYCKLVYEELYQNVESIWNHISKGEVVQKDMVEPFINYTNELGKMIRACSHCFDNNVKEEVTKVLPILHNVVQELDVTTNVFLNETLNSSNIKSVNDKIFKRCKVLVKTIKHLWTCIKTDEDESKDSFEDSQTYTKEDDRLKSILAKSRHTAKDRSICVTFNLGTKLNFTKNISRVAQSKRRLKFRDSSTDNDKIENSFLDVQRSFHTIASINEDLSS